MSTIYDDMPKNEYRLEWEDGRPRLRIYVNGERTPAFVLVEYHKRREMYKGLNMSKTDWLRLNQWFEEQDDKPF